MISAFICAFLATLGFSVLFHVPVRHIFSASLIGGLGWLAYEFCAFSGNGKIFSCFIGACVVGILGDIFARGFKEAATVFLIPGILPLVPGSGMYYTMLAIVGGDIKATAAIGTETLMMAGSIAAALLVVGSVIKVIVSVKRKFLPVRN